MKLHTAKRAVRAVIAAVLCTLLLLAFLPGELKHACVIALMAELGAEAVLCLLFLRCPHCGGQLHLSGQNYCPTCGKPLER